LKSRTATAVTPAERFKIAREIITEKLEPLLAAQIANAIGVSHFHVRDAVNKTTQTNYRSR
jgi:hypothetical protein